MSHKIYYNQLPYPSPFSASYPKLHFRWAEQVACTTSVQNLQFRLGLRGFPRFIQLHIFPRMTPVALVVACCAGCIFLRAWHWLYTASFSDVSLSTRKGRRNGASWRDVPFPAFFHFLWFSTRVSLEASVKEAGPGGSHTFLCGCDYFGLLVLQGLLGTSESQLRQREIKDL